MIIMHLIGRMFGTGASGSDRPPNAGTNGILRDSGREENAGAVDALVEPVEALGDELQRARRYEHAFSIVLVAARPFATEEEPHPEGADVDVRRRFEALPEELVPHLAAVGLREVLRATDIVCYDQLDGRFVLGLTESERPRARCAMARVGELFRRRLQIDLLVGVAQFPADGLTLEDLVETARAQVDTAEAGAEEQELGRTGGSPRSESEDEAGPWRDWRRPGSRRPSRPSRHAPAVPVNSQLARRGEG